MEFIIDSPKYGKHTVLIDDEDWDKVKKYKWGLNAKQSKIRSVQATVRKDNKKGTLLLHKLIMPSALRIDHIDCNPLNNRKNNLRTCTNAENLQNRGAAKNNTSGYKGVTYFRDNGRVYIVARICVNYKKIHIGIFPTEEAAALAYNKAALKYHGKFARLNDVKEAAL